MNLRRKNHVPNWIQTRVFCIRSPPLELPPFLYFGYLSFLTSFHYFSIPVRSENGLKSFFHSLLSGHQYKLMKAALERDCEPNEVMDPEKEVQKLKEEKGTNPYLQKKQRQ